MRRLTVLAALALGLAACGGPSVPKDAVKITVGLTGGSVMPYSITIAPGGAVTTKGFPPVKPKPLTSAEDVELSRLVRARIGKFKTLLCARSLSDEASRFITALGKTVAVRGTCEPGFTKLLYALTNALDLNK